jgi:serine/threonine protein kinase/Tfp pilus assembly protein PilF
MNGSATVNDVAKDIDPILNALVEQYANRLEAGEVLDVDQCASAHPEYADRLRKLLPTMQVLAELRRSSFANGAVSGNARAHSEVSGTLGDFRLLREIGRGGMGIVYEAEQISLGRTVALKVLPFASTFDPRQLQRFQNEARAAACLHHNSIVPVYAVGCERGVHYYAMQIIAGQSLDRAIAEIRKMPGKEAAGTNLPATVARDGIVDQQSQADGNGAIIAAPAHDTVREPRGQASTLSLHGETSDYFRRVAELTIQAAEGLEHAHQSGVVHRDVKPGNLLLDERGNLWVTDFGLAQFKNDAQLTMSGDLMGTLRYMSPEQALAQRIVVDHRTDIYSLGATLYEMLTLQPAFGGRDRQELLRQIAFEEPVRPRRLNRAIPMELETITAKAMEKNPAERYSTAKEMAEDLQRFLRDEPTLARRPTLWTRARKWSRRHRAGVRAAAIALVLVAIALTGMAGAWLSDWAHRRGETERAVNATLQEVDRLQKDRKLPDALARAKHAEAIMASGTPTPALEEAVLARRRDLQFVARLEDIRTQLAANVVMQEASFTFDYSQANSNYSRAFERERIALSRLTAEKAAEQIRQRSVAVELAAALDHWSSVAKEAGSKDSARWKHLLVVARLADPDPLRSKLRAALENKDTKTLIELAHQHKVEDLDAITITVFGQALRDQEATEEAITLLRAGQRQHRTDFWISFDLASQLSHQKPARNQEAIRFFTTALSIRPDVAGAHTMLGNLLSQTGQVDEAIAAQRDAVRLKPDFAGFHLNFGMALKKKWELEYAPLDPNDGNLVTAPARTELIEQALDAFNEALRLKPGYGQAINAITATLENQNLPEAIRNKHETADFLLDQAYKLWLTWKTAEAIKVNKRAVNVDPKNRRAHIDLGWRLVTADDPKLIDAKLAQEHVKKARELSKSQKGGEPRNTLGIALYRDGKWQEAIDNLDLAREARGPGTGCDSIFFLAMAHSKLGHQADARTWFDKALEWRRRRQDLDDRFDDFYQQCLTEAASVLGVPVGLEGARDFIRQGDWRGALAVLEKASKLDQEDHLTWYNAAPLHLLVNDVDGYRRVCREMLQRFGQTTDPKIADRTAKTCLLLPGAVSDAEYDLALKLADYAAADTTQRDAFPYFALNGAFADYRRGRYKRAIDRLNKDVVGRNIHIYGKAEAQLLLAMSHHQLQQTELAQKALAQAREIELEFPATGSRAVASPWRSAAGWPRFLILRREAEALIEKKAAPAPKRSAESKN